MSTTEPHKTSLGKDGYCEVPVNEPNDKKPSPAPVPTAATPDPMVERDAWLYSWYQWNLTRSFTTLMFASFLLTSTMFMLFGDDGMDVEYNLNCFLPLGGGALKAGGDFPHNTDSMQ